MVLTCSALLDHKTNDFTLEIVGFFVCGLASFGFDHNAKDFIWSIAGQAGFFGRNIICCDMRVSVDANALKSWLAIIRAVPSNFQAENASLNNWIALCRMDS